ncbi:hypothetical protein JX265_002978 [Neoarthrinium moseri]|uniref:Peroxisomal membrane protein PEX14 n=1 Tax=Neoarthrinium moseri TaxID=1658444 RepID=A0A9Q0ASU5_9PEZI|nr:hypothetical protein JX266_009689 [Neoarthrinium moseri]KAI1878801.1 hypothetical protein JX265_002978 [Neoarthrinium moseri]
MAESEKPDVPAWQRQAGSETTTDPAPSTTLEQARRFLSDDNVRSSSAEKKTEFLKSKGISDEDIQKLLAEEAQQETEPEPRESPVEQEIPDAKQTSHQHTQDPASTSASAQRPSDTPPIITYPEFLTHSPRPPPLLTPSRLLNVLTVSGTAWTLLYGAARFVVSPMVDSLTESRSDYYNHVNTKMSSLVEKLEGVVSEVPYKNGKPLKSEMDIDDNSSYGDPTEMFHRDFGTQTSPQTSPLPTSEADTKPIDEQAQRLAQLTSSLKELTDAYTNQAENSEDLRSILREFRDDVDKLAYPSVPDYTYSGSGFGLGRSTEPDDEIRKTKDAIRSVKGMFLSSRMFPAAAAR